jgi:hypothetical protein
MTGCAPDRECIHPTKEHRGAARIGRAKIGVFERDDVHSSPLLKHENVFYRVKNGDLFGVSSGKRKFRYTKERCLLVEQSAKARHEERSTSSAKQRIPQYQFSRKTTVIEFWCVLFRRMILGTP